MSLPPWVSNPNSKKGREGGIQGRKKTVKEDERKGVREGITKFLRKNTHVVLTYTTIKIKTNRSFLFTIKSKHLPNKINKITIMMSR